MFVLNVAHNSMCYFNVSTIDPAVFAHCSLRLGLVYESLANVLARKTAKESVSQVEPDDTYSIARTTNTKFSKFFCVILKLIRNWAYFSHDFFSLV